MSLNPHPLEKEKTTEEVLAKWLFSSSPHSPTRDTLSLAALVATYHSTHSYQEPSFNTQGVDDNSYLATLLQRLKSSGQALQNNISLSK